MIFEKDRVPLNLLKKAGAIAWVILIWNLLRLLIFIYQCPYAIMREIGVDEFKLFQRPHHFAWQFLGILAKGEYFVVAIFVAVICLSGALLARDRSGKLSLVICLVLAGLAVFFQHSLNVLFAPPLIGNTR